MIRILEKEGDEVLKITVNISIIIPVYVGIFSALASLKIGANSGGGVHSFEPVPYIVKILEKTAELNGNIKIVPMALSDSVGKVDISIATSRLCGI